MTATAQPTRSITETIDIKATPEDVWNALATSEGARRWLAFDARVDQQAPGEYFLSWGAECEGSWKIESFEPPRRLVLIDEGFVPGMVQTMEFTIEATAGGVTTLHMTHAGIGAEEQWDEMYDSMNRGWAVFFHTARHAVERHPGEDRVVAQARCKPSLSREEVWKRLMGEDGLRLSHEEADGTEFGRFAFGDDGATGDTWIWNPPKDLAGTIPALNDAAFWIALEQGGDSIHLDITLSGFGLPESEVRAVADRWQATLDRLFPAA